MAEADVDVLRRFVAALNGGDVEATVEVFDREVIFEPRRASVQGAYIGHDGIREWLADTKESFAAYRFEVEHRDLGDGRVLSTGGLHVRGQGSGIDTEAPVASIAVVRDGKILRLKDYGEPREAIHAAGLEK
jgi:uncharacterized protein